MSLKVFLGSCVGIRAQDSQIVGPTPIQVDLEGKRHPFGCLKTAGLGFELRPGRRLRDLPVEANIQGPSSYTASYRRGTV
jgi:hypothetical protein